MILTPAAHSAARDLLERSVAWMDRYWDAERGLLWEMGEVADPCGSAHAPYHIVRESAWYALGLLMRHKMTHEMTREITGDAASCGRRAVQALEAILTYQFDEPGKVYHGTFYRAPEEPHPPEPASEWKHYDPNWREFIITTLAVILSEYEEELPRTLVAKMEVGIRKAVEGALVRPLVARYTNIALMDAQMLVWAGNRLGERAWIEAGEAMGREVHRLFMLHDAFAEYNSPTYYGTDIYALGLWQVYCPSPQLRQMGAEIEELLWRDIALFYHAGLRNMAGPYDRSYGMDMCRYVALLGAWIWLITGREDAPFPDVACSAQTDSFAHAADFCFGPLVAILGPRVPADVIPHLKAFQGERCVERVIGDSPNAGAAGLRRTATAWLGEKAMIGAEHTSLSDIGQSQFHPATIHWRAGPGQVGWVRLLAARPVDAVASPYRLEVTGSGSLVFQIDAPWRQVAAVQPDHWQLPGLEVRVVASAPGEIVEAGEAGFGPAFAPVQVEGVGRQVLVRYAAADGQKVRIVLDLLVDQKG